MEAAAHTDSSEVKVFEGEVTKKSQLNYNI